MQGRNEDVFSRSSPQSEKYVHFNQRPLDIAGFIHVHLTVGKQELKRARISVTAKDRSQVGRDWLAARIYQFTPFNQIAASESFSMTGKKLVNAVNSSAILDIEWSEVKKAFQHLFRGQGRIKDHAVRLEFKEDVNLRQKKDDVFPFIWKMRLKKKYGVV